MRAPTREDYAARMNRVMDYIYGHLDGDLRLARLAREAAFSPFHFHRLFRTLTGESTAGFIQRARLERAVFMLMHQPHRRIKEIAADCGFTSAAAFSRAFRQKHGFAASRFSAAAWRKRKIGKALPLASRHHLREISRTSRPPRLRVRLETKPAMPYAYIRVLNPYASSTAIPDAYRRLQAWLAARGLAASRLRMIGCSPDDPEIVPLEKCRYDCAYLLPPGNTWRGTGEVGVSRLAGGRYAVLPARGNLRTVDRAWNLLFKSWLPASGLQPRHQPGIEVYLADPAAHAWSWFDLEGWVAVEPAARTG